MSIPRFTSSNFWVEIRKDTFSAVSVDDIVVKPTMSLRKIKLIIVGNSMLIIPNFNFSRY